jgi:hypothetical protein
MFQATNLIDTRVTSPTLTVHCMVRIFDNVCRRTSQHTDEK